MVNFIKVVKNNLKKKGDTPKKKRGGGGKKGKRSRHFLEKDYLTLFLAYLTVRCGRMEKNLTLR